MRNLSLTNWEAEPICADCTWISMMAAPPDGRLDMLGRTRNLSGDVVLI
jgi:hypothetical protein